MKILKSLKIAVLSVFMALMVFLAGCEKNLLDLTPHQSVSDEEFLKTLSDFKAAIIGVYDQLSIPDWYGRYMLLVPDVMGEDVKQNAQANRAKEWAEYNGSTTTTHRIDREFWAEIYEGIHMVNRIINADFEPSDAVRDEYNQVLGEAYAIRGLAYFDLVRLFAQHYTFTPDASHPGVPIVLEFDINQKPARNTVKEVYDQIISDFQKGISLMTIDPPNAGRMSKEAAQALLSRVYLYKEDWAKAEELATAVINSGKYTLVSRDQYLNMFFPGLSSEAIFEMVYTVADNPGSNHLGGMYKSTGYGDYLPSNDLISMIDDNDIRKGLFIVDPELPGGKWGNLRVNKYPSSGAEIATDNLPVIRLSEVYLIRAEARAHLGNEAGAIEDLMTIRRRAWPDAPDVTATGQDLLEEIYKERRIELCFEGHRIFDITRQKKDLVRVDCTAPVCTVPYPNDLFILPIPFEEVNVNPNITQNPGY